MGEFNDITKTGIQPVRNPDLYGGGNEQLPPITYEEALNKYQNTHRAFQAASRGYMGYEDMYDTFDNDTSFGADNSRSRYDSTPVINGITQDVLNNRAENQPWIEQMTNGILKGVVTAGTTFVDGIVGSVVGIGNLVAQAGQGNINSGKEALNAFIDNPVSKWLQQVNDSFEKWLPNYYTQEEQQSVFERPENIMHANFIGDKFLKNLGFMIGAAYSGRVSAGAVAQLTGLNKARNAFKGLNIVAKDGTKIEEISKIAEAAAKGEAFMDGEVLTETLAKEAKNVASQEWALKIYGAVTAAIGEARIEAIQNTKDWYERDKTLVNDNTERLKQNILNEIYEEANETGAPYFTLQFDNETGSAAPVLTEEGKIRYIQRLNEIDEQASQALEQLDKDRAAVANNIFLLNTVLLSGTNLFEYGRFLAGGYNTNKKLVKDYVKKAIKGAEKPYEELNKEARRAAIKAASVPFMEGGEEISQRYISTAVGLKHSADLNKFYGYKIDPDAEEDSISTINAAIQGFKETFTDPSAWEEFLIGGLSAMVGMPAFNIVHNEDGTIQYKERQRKDGTVEKIPVKKFQMDGEFWGGIRDAREASKKSKELTDKLNEAIQNPDFLNYWRGYSRHKALDKEKEDFLKLGDSFRFKNADNDQRISDMLMFEEAGRIQDVYDMIEEGLSVKLEDVPSIRQDAAKDQGNEDPFKDMTDEQVLEHVHKQAKDMKEWLPKYLEVRSNIKTVYGNDIDPDFLDELTHQYLTIDDAETRTKSLVEKLLPDLNNIINRMAKLSGDDSIKQITNLTDLSNAFANKSFRNKFIDALESYETTEDLGTLIMNLKLLERTRQKALDTVFNEELEGNQRAEAKRVYDDALLNTLRLNTLIAGIKNGEFKQFSPAEVENLWNDTFDLLKLTVYRSNFIDALNTLSTNPRAFTKEAVKAREVLLEKLKDKQTTSIYDSLVQKASSEEGLTQKEFNEALSSDSAIQSGLAKAVRERIINEDNEQLKELLRRYDDSEKFKNAVLDLANEEGPLQGIYAQLYEQLLEDPDAEELTPAEYLDDLSMQASEAEDPVLASSILDAISEIRKRLGIIKSAEGMIKNDEKPTKKKEEEPEPTEDDSEEPESVETDDAKHAEDLQRRISYFDLEQFYTVQALKDIVDGVTTFDGFTKEEQDLLKQAAAAALQRRRSEFIPEELGSSELDRQNADGSFEEANKDDVADKNDNPKFRDAEKGSLRGVSLTRFNIDSLKKLKNLKAYEGQTEKQKLLIHALDALKMYDFIDTGALAALYRYEYTHGHPEGVHLIFMARPGSEVFTTKRDDKEGNLYNILLAVEVTDTVRQVLQPWENRGLTNYQTAADGKQYQIVGILKNPDQENDDSKKAYWDIYNRALPKSIMRQYIASKQQDNFYIAYREGTTEPLYTTIKDFYSGRMALTQVEDSEATDVDIMSARQFRPMANLSDAIVGGHGWAVIVANKERGVEPIFSPGIDPSRIQRFRNMPTPTWGSIWLLVPGANGKYYYQHTEVKRLAEYDFTQDNYVVKYIKQNIEILLDSKKPFVTRLKAKENLKDLIYLPKNYEFSLHPKEDGARIANREVTTFEEAIQALKDSKARFQISKDVLSKDTGNIDDLAESGLILTDYIDHYHHNANYTVNYLSDNGIPVRTTKKVTLTEGLNLSGGKQENLKIVQNNGTNYEIDTNTKTVYKKGTEITGPEADEIRFLFDIMTDQINGEEGDHLTLYTREIDDLLTYAVKYGSNNIPKIITDSSELKQVRDNIAQYKAKEESKQAGRRLNKIFNEGDSSEEGKPVKKGVETAPEEPKPATPVTRQEAGETSSNRPMSPSERIKAAAAKRKAQRNVRYTSITEAQEAQFNTLLNEHPKFSKWQLLSLYLGEAKSVETVSKDISLEDRASYEELGIEALMQRKGISNVEAFLDDLKHFINCKL